MKASIKKKQKGSALTILVSLSFIIMMVALVVDAGQVYLQQRQLQSTANTLASKLADQGQTCFGDELASGATTLSPSIPSDVDYTVQMAEAVFIKGKDGKLSASTVSDARESNGVAVSLTKPVTGLLAFALDNHLSAHAVAKKEVNVLFSMSPVVVDAGGNSDTASVLNVVLGVLFNDGSPYSIPVDGFGSLRDFTMDLGDFINDAGVGVILNQLPVDGYELTEQIKNIAGTTGNSDLVGFADDLLASSVDLKGVSVEEVFNVVDESASIPANSQIPIYDLLVVTALNAVEGLTLPLNDIGLNLAGVTSVSGSIRVLEAPSFVFAPARKAFIDGEYKWVGESAGANISVFLETKIDLPITILGTGLEAKIDLPLSVEVGNANTKLVSAKCAKGKNNKVEMGFRGSTSIANLTGSADILTTLKLLGIPIELVGTRLEVDAPVGTSSYDEKGKGLMPPRKLDDFEPIDKRVGEGLGFSFDDAGLKVSGHPESKGGVSTVINALLSPIVAILSGTLTNTLESLLGVLSNLVLNPLLAALGVGIGEGNIQVAGASQSNTQIIECDRALCQPK